MTPLANRDYAILDHVHRNRLSTPEYLTARILSGRHAECRQQGHRTADRREMSPRPSNSVPAFDITCWEAVARHW